MSTLRDFRDEIKAVRERAQNKVRDLSYKFKNVEQTDEDLKTLSRLRNATSRLCDAEGCLQGE